MANVRLKVVPSQISKKLIFQFFIFTQLGTDVEHHLKQKRHVRVMLFSIYENICLLVLAVLRLFG